MFQRMPGLLLSVAAIGFLTAVGQCPALGVEPNKEPRIVSTKTGPMILDGDHRAVLVYRQRGVGTESKHYVEQLFSPGGVQVLRDSPHDHKHHHALMFATAVNGVDFWSDGPSVGRQKDVSLTLQKAKGSGGASHAAFVEMLNWLDPRSDKPLLIERRTIAAVKTPGNRATLVEWRSQLQVPPGKDSAVLTGAHYFGLGLRFVQSMDTGGQFFNADDKAGELVAGSERVTPVKWCAYTAKAQGKPVTVAVFAHPMNLRHPAEMFTMNQPFAYISATCRLWKKPLTIKAGEPLDLRYGVAVWDGTVDKKAVETLYQHWLKASNDKSTK